MGNSNAACLSFTACFFFSLRYLNSSARLLGITRLQSIEEDYAADRAVAEVINKGILKPQSKLRFDCKRVMGTRKDFHLWMDEFIMTASLPSQESLVQKVERAYKSTF